jgi:hypothetical protein
VAVVSDRVTGAGERTQHAQADHARDRRHSEQQARIAQSARQLAYVAFSCGQAAFPSPGDHIGTLGVLALTAVLAVTIGLLLANGGRACAAR